MKQNQETDITTEKKENGFHININIILLCVILLIAGFSAYRLYKWNKGVPSDYDPNYQTTDFDIEVMDNIIPLAPDKLEGHEDDGVTTILCLGDDPFLLKYLFRVSSWIREKADWQSRLLPKPVQPSITVLLPEPPWQPSLIRIMTAIFWMPFLSLMWHKAWHPAILI